MVDAVTTVGGGGSIAPIGQQVIGSSAAVGVTAQTAIQNATPTTPPADGFLNRLYDDPSTGVLVSAQLNSSGGVVLQTPSGFVLAYLRNGLSADGLPPKTSVTA